VFPVEIVKRSKKPTRQTMIVGVDFPLAIDLNERDLNLRVFPPKVGKPKRQLSVYDREIETDVRN
jgi:hypothetical protein